MGRPHGRPSFMRKIENRNYKIGLCLAILRKFGPMTSVELAKQVGIRAQALRNVLEVCDQIQFKREPYNWFYDRTGDRENKTVRRDILVFSYTEVTSN